MSGISGSTPARVADEFPEPGYVHRLRRVDPLDAGSVDDEQKYLSADAAGRAVAPRMVSDHVAPPFRIPGADFRTVPKIAVWFREFDPFNCVARHGRGGEVWYSLK